MKAYVGLYPTRHTVQYELMFHKRTFFILFLALFLCVSLGISQYFSALAQSETKNVAVTATVPADADDLPVQLIQNTPGTRFPQQTTLDYTVTYGSQLDANVDLTLVVSWSRGTLDGDSSPSVDILDYVPGSATNAYNSTPPVVDTVNRRITWTITNFPGNSTAEQVQFRLKTNSSYTGAPFATFSVNAQSSGASATSAVSTVSKEYQYDDSLNPTATPTVTPTPTSRPGPSATPGPKPSVSPTPTRAPVPADLPFRFTNISLEAISPNSASILISATQESMVTLSYGTSITTMNEELEDLSFLRSRLLLLTGLKANTRYYFRLTGINRAKQIITSELFTFVTGRAGETPVLDRSRTIITSEHILLYPSSTGTFVLTKNTNYELNVVFTNPRSLRRAVLRLRSENVLGIVTPTLLKSEVAGGELKEIAPGKYAIRLTSPRSIGMYDLDITIYDTNGNIITLPIGSLKVSNFLTLFDAQTRQPVERARVKLLLYNYRTGKYVPISSRVIPLPSPLFSDYDGTVKVVLPQGNYRADITSATTKPKNVEFVIGDQSHQEFPTVYLEHETLGIISFIRYQLQTCMDFFAAFKAAVTGFSQSLRLFELNAYVVLLTFVILSYVALSRRLRIPLRWIWAHFRHRARGSYFSSTRKRITGRVLAAGSNEPISSADVYLINPRNNAVLGHVVSHADGSFGFSVYDTHRYVFEVLKQGCMQNRFHEDMLTEDEQGYTLAVKQHLSARQVMSGFFDQLFSAGLELILLVSFILEVFFIYVFGITKTAPYLVLSIFCLFLIIFHATRRDDE